MVSFAQSISVLAAFVGLAAMTPAAAYAADGTSGRDEQQNRCAELPAFNALQQALRASVKASGGPSNGGLDTNMWASIVDRDGIVCVVTFSGQQRGDQWPGSRVISAQKANTANSFSLDFLALSTANLYAAVQPGGSLYGLQHSNPVDPEVAYRGPSRAFGMPGDPMVGDKIGGVNVFGGGLALYSKGKVLGALGVSGDTSCADHNVAWRVRRLLRLDGVPDGVLNHTDGIIYDNDGPVSSTSGAPAADFHSISGFGHPQCGGHEAEIAEGIGAGKIVTGK
jgi:uncharacterized protein GlcG (DUF336 family)